MVIEPSAAVFRSIVSQIQCETFPVSFYIACAVLLLGNLQKHVKEDTWEFIPRKWFFVFFSLC